MIHNTLERFGKGRTGILQFLPIQGSDAANQMLTMRGKLYEDFAAILLAVPPDKRTAFD